MRHGLWILALAALLGGCSTNYEAECLDLCDRIRRCIEDPSPAEFEACNDSCRTLEIEGQKQIADGTLSMDCYDAVTDQFVCYNRLNCRELGMTATSTPARCKEEVENAAAVCN